MNTVLKNPLWLSCLFALLSACAMAPISGGYSAKPLGIGKAELTGTTSLVDLNGEPTHLPMTHFRLLLGVSEQLDVGMNFDQYTTTLLTKYSLTSTSDAWWRVAFIGGVTRIAATSGWSAGVINSFYWQKVELTTMLRYNEAVLNLADFDYKYLQISDSAIHRFGLLNVGVKYWLRPKLSIGVDWALSPWDKGDRSKLPIQKKVLPSLMVGFVF